MTRTTLPRRLGTRAVAGLVLAVLCSTGLAACGRDSGGGDADPSASESATASEDTSPAGLAVTAGLAKHVAATSSVRPPTTRPR